ncbi:RDD family protein [Alteribacter keqinensis]|uniref:RDD family protein n=1 Tax=Alteribacter keqinensis TaxID=2483800 RepID=A0A3M7TV26_9BACI|nr:RDD family protein [Alteribacter keqinensis]RNA68584.1 RDD family protein [Alteribacter keqinensis]
MTPKDNAAGFLPRLGALLADSFLILLPATLIVSLVMGENWFTFIERSGWDYAYVVYLTVTPLLWKGYVVGKRLLRIRIARIDGKPLTIWTMLMRQVIGYFLLAMFTFGLTTFISLILVIVRKDHRSLHDLIAGTYVEKV